MILQSCECIYSENLRYEHNENFKESILRDKHCSGFQI